MTLREKSIAMLVCLLLFSGVAAGDDSVVLVTNIRCPVSDLSNLDIRKSYLGVTVRVGDRTIRPLRLVGDPDLDRIFFQIVVAMSEKSYERRALSLALKYGTPRPAEHETVEQALAALQRTSCGVLFLWEDDVKDRNNTKRIRVLWQGS
jgi:hypothetical protein